MATNVQHPHDIYQSSAGGNFYSPFNLRVDPMQRLLLINFQRDPDEVYLGFEPQVFDDPVNGHGMIVIAWRNDGRVDIYHQPTISQAHKNYDIIGKGLADLVERPFEGARYEVGSHGVDLQFAFEDKLGRPIAVCI